MPQIDARTFNMDIVEWHYNADDDTHSVRLIDDYGDSVLECGRNVELANDAYKHTSLYLDRFVRIATDWQNADNDYPLVGGTTLIGLA